MVSKYKKILLASFAVLLLAGSLSGSILTSSVGAAAKDGKCSSADKTAGGTDAKETVNGREKDVCNMPDEKSPGTGTDPTQTSDNETTCAIEKMGWILCPIIETSGKVSDQAFQYLSKTFLETEPELVSNSNAGTKQAWELARNLANIMFIIAFLVIIYSQVTGAGITNYGIKKMLPRLIVAAIAVNASYYICQILVDLTNIMGYEIQKFLVDTARSITSNAVMPIASDGPSLSQDSGTLSQIAIGVLAVGAIVYFLLPVLGSVVLFVLITCLSIIIILLLRKTFIVLLIVAAPVAFVLYLLPNTEKYFQKWLSMFWKLLLVFPVVGILMGGGQLASSIILVAGTQSTNYKDTGEKCITLPQYSGSTQSQANAWSWLGGGQQSNQATVTGGAAIGTCTAGSVPFMLGLTAAGIAVLPLLAVWSVLKGALAATGAIGGKLGATINGMNSGAKGKLQKARQERGEYLKNRRQTAALSGTRMGNLYNAATLGGARRSARRKGRYSAAQHQLSAAQGGYDNAARLGRRGTTEDARRALEQQERKINADNVSIEHLTVDAMDTGTDNTGGVAGQEAQALIASGQFDSPRLAALLEHLNTSNHSAFMAIASGLRGTNLATQTASKAMSSAGIYGGGDIARMAQGNQADGLGDHLNLSQAAVNNAAAGGLSAASIASASNSTLAGLADAVAAANASGDAVQQFQATMARTNVQGTTAGMSQQLSEQMNDRKRNTINGM